MDNNFNENQDEGTIEFRRISPNPNDDTSNNDYNADDYYVDNEEYYQEDNQDDDNNDDYYEDDDDYNNQDDVSIIEDDNPKNNNNKKKSKKKFKFFQNSNSNNKINISNNQEFNSKIQAIKYLVGDINFMDIIVRLFASYFIVMLHKTARIEEKFSNLDFGKNIEVPSFILQIIMIFVLLSVAKFVVSNFLRTKLNTDGYFLGTSVMLYGIYTVFRLNNFYYAMGVSIVIAIVMTFLLHNGYFKEFSTLSKWQTRIIVGILFGSFAVYVGGLCVYRYLCYTTSCFDFGIFCQMFYYMAHHGLPSTTCERNYLLSHFAVHVSPIYYLMLPIFAIFQSPVTLLVCQAIIVASGVIPLYLICKDFKFSNGSTIGLCCMFIFSPALICSTFFDFHENKFLVPLIMWVFWAIQTRHTKLMYLFVILTLLVKEDAFIYISSIALFVITSNLKYGKKDTSTIDISSNKTKPKNRIVIHGAIILILALLYFFVISKLMEKYGLGVMEYRYSNVMMDPDKGLLNVIKTIALNPALAIYEAFSEDKLLFFLQMVAPLLFLPFVSKKISHVFLLIPFFIVNLISDYPYQTEIGFQYVCGVMSVLIYLSVLNLHELKTIPKRYIATVCMCSSMILGTMYASDKLVYFDSYHNYYGRIMRMNNLLSRIPQDASVECTTYYVPQLSQRDEVYMMEDKEVIPYDPTDFIVVRVGSGEEDFVEERLSWAVDNGYEFYNGYSDLLYVFVKSDYIEQHPELRDYQRLEPIIVEE